MTARAELVPGPRWSPPVGIPHVLVVTGGDVYEKDYEIEHPADCARSCPWWPTVDAADCLILGGDWHVAPQGYRDDGAPDCYVEWEVANAGLDCLAGEVYGLTVDGIDGWRALPSGRYLIEGWYQPPGWAGGYPIDADGGVCLTGLERPRPYSRLRPGFLLATRRTFPRRVRLGLSRGIRVRRLGRLVVRGPKNQPYFSERNRHGCRIVPLGRGWRIVLESPRSAWPFR